THIYADNGTYTASVIVTDPDGAADTAAATVVVANAPPAITSFTVPLAPVAGGAAAPIGLTFTDAGAGDTHSIQVDWGDGNSTGALSHAYAAPGFYIVTVTVRDDDGATDSRTAQTAVVVYDPDGAFVTGSGWIAVSGDKANFGFQSRYADGAARGEVELHVNARQFRFSSE